MKGEPLIHSDISDGFQIGGTGDLPLPSNHVLFHEKIYCKTCMNQVYDGTYRENDMTWVETGVGNYCLACFYLEVKKRNKESCPNESVRYWDLCGYDLNAFGFWLNSEKKITCPTVQKCHEIIGKIKECLENIKIICTIHVPPESGISEELSGLFFMMDALIADLDISLIYGKHT